MPTVCGLGFYRIPCFRCGISLEPFGIQMTESSRYIVAVDIGTTTVRACLFNGRGRMVESASQPMKKEVRHDSGHQTVEINPDMIMAQFLDVAQQMISLTPAGASVSMGVCTQRNSFLFYDKETLKPYGNFICWNDLRAAKKCDEWNRSFVLKTLHVYGGVLHWLTRQPRYRAAKVLKFLTSMVSFRLLAAIEEDENLLRMLKAGRLAFGCLDTWIILKLSKGRTVVSEASNTSSTGMFDPFLNAYNSSILSLIHFPKSLLVPIGESATTGKSITTVDEDVFGRPVEVSCMLADQCAALFGCGGWTRGDVMISMGTGTFVQKNLDEKPHASMRGLYPLVGWKLDGKTTFIAEGQENDTAAIIEWAQRMSLFDDVSKTSAIAESIPSSNGCFFVPAFGGLQTPRNDDRACSSMMGMTSSSTKAEMLRAVLEAIAFRVYEIYQTMQKEIVDKSNSHTRVCGGVSSNDFVCQTIATLIDRPVERVEGSSFAASKGVALMAGLVQGFWTKEDLNDMVRVERVFYPKVDERASLLRTFSMWQRAVQRCQNFYDFH